MTEQEKRIGETLVKFGAEVLAHEYLCDPIASQMVVDTIEYVELAAPLIKDQVLDAVLNVGGLSDYQKQQIVMNAQNQMQEEQKKQQEILEENYRQQELIAQRERQRQELLREQDALKQENEAKEALEKQEQAKQEMQLKQNALKQETASREQFQKQEEFKAEVQKQEALIKQEAHSRQALELQQIEKDRENARQEQLKQLNDDQEKAKRDMEARHGHSIIASKPELTPQPDWQMRVNAAEEARKNFLDHQNSEIDKKTLANFEARHDLLRTPDEARKEERVKLDAAINGWHEQRAAAERARDDQMQQIQKLPERSM